MKPCFKNRKSIAWLVTGSLDPEQATTLREHLETCEGCRRYLDQLSKIATALTAVEIEADAQASPSFHRRLVARVKAADNVSIFETTRGFLPATLLNWRVALPVAGVIAVVLGVFFTVQQHSEVSFSTPSRAKPPVVSRLQPTLANYQMVANQSLEKLDQLLTEQGTRNLPPSPIYTASTPPGQEF